jgi:PKD repeat protein
MRVQGALPIVVLVGACGKDALHDRANRPPTAICGEDRTAALGQEVFFDGSASFDPDGDGLSFSWDFGDSTRSDGRALAHPFGTAGVFRVTLTVTDERDASDRASLQVSVTDNQAPVAVISAPPTGVAGAGVHLDGSGSFDPDGAIVDYAWAYDVGGGHATVAADPVFDIVGPVVVTLTVTDNDGATDTAQQTVTVSADYDGIWAWGLDDQADASDPSCGTFYSSTIAIAVAGSSITFTEEGTLGDVIYQGTIVGNAFSATAPLSSLGGTQTIAATFTTPTHFAGTYRVEYGALGCDRTRNVHGDKQ